MPDEAISQLSSADTSRLEVIEGTVLAIAEALRNVAMRQITVLQKVEKIMSDQSHLQTDVTSLEASETAEASALADFGVQLTAIQAAVAALKAANPSIDFSELDSVVSTAATNAATAQSTDATIQADATADAPAAPVPGS